MVKRNGHSEIIMAIGKWVKNNFWEMSVSKGFALIKMVKKFIYDLGEPQTQGHLGDKPKPRGILGIKGKTHFLFVVLSLLTEEVHVYMFCFFFSARPSFGFLRITSEITWILCSLLRMDGVVGW